MKAWHAVLIAATAAVANMSTYGYGMLEAYGTILGRFAMLGASIFAGLVVWAALDWLERLEVEEAESA